MEREHRSADRFVVLRWDVPGKDFNPNDDWVLRTPEGRALADAALDRVCGSLRERLASGRLPAMVEDLLQMPDVEIPALDQ